MLISASCEIIACFPYESRKDHERQQLPRRKDIGPPCHPIQNNVEEASEMIQLPFWQQRHYASRLTLKTVQGLNCSANSTQIAVGRESIPAARDAGGNTHNATKAGISGSAAAL
jgi:hypothetical protein